jgi:hypothetical protein
VLLRDQPSAAPSHRETLPNPDEPEKQLVFEEIASLVAAFETYVNARGRVSASGARQGKCATREADGRAANTEI